MPTVRLKQPASPSAGVGIQRSSAETRLLCSSTSTARSQTWLENLGVVDQALCNWVRQERIDRGEREGTTTEIREKATTPMAAPA